MADFHGVFPAIITPLTADDTLNEKAFREVMEFNIQAGVHGFWVAGGTGESIHLDDAENRRIAELAADQAQGRIKNILHVGAATTKRAARLAEHGAKVGVDAICCVPPFFYPPTDKEVVEHYRVVAAAADLPFFVYNLPQCTGTEISPELMRKIQDQVPQLKGLKHSAPTFSNTPEFARMGLDCLIGNSSLMLPALTLGAVGCIDGPPNIAPERWLAIWNAYQEGDMDKAQTAQEKASEVTDLVRRFGLHATCKFLLSTRLGIDCGMPRAPLSGLSETEQEQILAMCDEIGLGKAQPG